LHDEGDSHVTDIAITPVPEDQMNLAGFLEIVAGALHKGAGYDNQSTTTVAYYDATSTLYITSQTISDYSAVLKSYKTNGVGGHKKVYRDDGFLAFLQNLRSSIKPAEQDDYDDYADDIYAVKVVQDAELFISGIEKSGLHGESRLIRFLVIKELRGAAPEDALKPPSGQDEKKYNDWRKKVRTRFTDHLTFGSSQGACLVCADYLDRLGLSYGSTQKINKDRDGTWRHPLTLTTKERNFGPPSTNTYLATSVAAHHYSLLHPATSQDGKMETN